MRYDGLFDTLLWLFISIPPLPSLPSSPTPPPSQDRAPWLQALHVLLAGWVAAGGGGQGVLACSALRRSYRDILVGRGKGEDDISSYCTFVFLQGPFEVLQVRVQGAKCTPTA